ncbi:hypothetical protein SAMN00768000_3615 [Sulfobacillus thermosulfidooxidans DSM 9293]|uniref:Uncharacterized protein n=1 Tax=Sulfobacillus thermosulfidooxidans (strain DSM 9293 / VKM B-1269 / AT-1) TaxID=929705 RepID=A0A1W1WP14_SULTA|nr:hypothetical protein [Sulfobacillus thermosulfidooxidans]SMC08047.1 hypothetical protein SAMN00768000_3615 [Sulfobacillus thermosulfidooxidans DSM 9293]
MPPVLVSSAFPTGVITVPGWSAKPWFSHHQHRWLVQLERYDPPRGGWLWHPNTNQPQTFLTLDAAQDAALAFCAEPTLALWHPNRGMR